MGHLYEKLAARVDAWRAADYPLPEYPAIGEILEYALEGESGTLRFLRRPQLRALETYWYLRLVEETPHVSELYDRLFPPHDDLSSLLEALGVSDAAFKAANYEIEGLFLRIRNEDEFVRSFKLEALRETLSLGYPSYILALAMGAGKTILIGAIIASEFAMALEYPDGPFVQNALVFAPGKTIIESLRELAATPYDRLLPPRMHKSFAASVKLTFTRDGEKDLPVIRGSSFNVVVTNTEKIRIQKETIRKADFGGLFGSAPQDEQRQEVANLRLQAIASLPHLAVFSDEAHHTYGQSLDAELKKVRKTVDYLATATHVLCVVNTTGTPYFQRQALKDVVVWYGLSQGIRDGILKDLSGNIQAYEFEGDAKAYVSHVIEDFFGEYGQVRLPDGAPARLAMYFPQTDDLAQLRPAIDEALVRMGQSPALCLVNTSALSLTKQGDIDAFNRLNDPAAPHRVVLLVNKGTEGWNCPSLFACALVRRLKTSNNFVLQAATRCLRQVPGNTRKARVYLSADNYGILDRQLQETYGESIEVLTRAGQESRRARIVLRKLDIPPLVVTKLVRTMTRKEGSHATLRLVRPGTRTRPALRRRDYSMAEQEATRSVLRQVGDTQTLESQGQSLDVRTAAVELAARYRLDLWALYDQIAGTYGSDDVPVADLDELAAQIEKQSGGYEVAEETVDVALALVKPEGFSKEEASDGSVVYTAEIVYHKDREHLLLPREAMTDRNARDLGFHYTPYGFDSNPEKSFFEQLLVDLDLRPGEIEEVLFTGAVTDPAKTDFFVEYKDEKGRWHRYTPDFIIRRKPDVGKPAGSGRTLIVEIKWDRDRATVEAELAAGRAATREGRKALAVKAWEGLQPDRIKYQLIFTTGDTAGVDQVRDARRTAETDPW